ncbi:hypothetical protein EOS_35590 [Caballeronia mineralivorans PML1(12)]|uniref:Flagellar motor switch protein FliN-like C-terminal domain-containing protein n=1 Tax=Caballeronia mineralivorans PML1(12) TaxID=908627 RepID=A0A0J1CL95_9BURK|nr:type III secretion system cytoplasmic ring protein SctQ [Caballeronia mineralivorans]KLU21497.1 hypothetical protein EOS_35590 [Caballeronia mineralivorans PML1(12)]
MSTLEWDEDELDLAREISSGRRTQAGDVELTLDYRELGGEGLLVSLSVAGQSALAWVAEAGLSRWLAPKLAAPTFADLPPDLVRPLAAWALAPLVRHADAADVADIIVNDMVRGTCTTGFGCVVTLTRDDASLSLRPIGWPTRVLKDLAQTMISRVAPHRLPPLPIPLVAGWGLLTRAHINSLSVGDGVVLGTSASVERGELWLFQHRPLARVMLFDDKWQVNWVMDGQEMRRDMEGMPLKDEATLLQDDVAFTVVAEVATMTLSLDELQGLSAGQILNTGVAYDGRVALKVNGRKIGCGRLIRIGEQLVVRVE